MMNMLNVIPAEQALPLGKKRTYTEMLKAAMFMSTASELLLWL